jgi:large subunit ribosomal protein L4
MANVKLVNMAGQEVGSMSVHDSIFGAPVNEALVHEVVVAQLANARQGTKANLSRSEVRGHAKKPYKQKHTGNARQGSTKGPHQTGGGNAFAVKPRDFSKKVNKQAKRAAFVSALSAKFANNDIIFLDEYKLEQAKTKLVEQFVKNHGLTSNALVVLAQKDENATRATANHPVVSLALADNVSVYEIVRCKKLILTKDAVKLIEEGIEE